MTGKETEIIYMPYSFYSQKGYEAVIDALHKMGYSVAKTYPDDKKADGKGEIGHKMYAVISDTHDIVSDIHSNVNEVIHVCNALNKNLEPQDGYYNVVEIIPYWQAPAKDCEDCKFWEYEGPNISWGGGERCKLALEIECSKNDQYIFFEPKKADGKQDDVIRVGDTVECIENSVLEGEVWGVKGKHYLVEGLELEHASGPLYIYIQGNDVAVKTSRFRKVKQDDKEAEGKGDKVIELEREIERLKSANVDWRNLRDTMQAEITRLRKGKPTEEYICENADKCWYNLCNHVEPHPFGCDHDEDSESDYYCDAACGNSNGIKGSKCIPLSEYEKRQRPEPKYKVGQKVVNKQRKDDRGYTYQRVIEVLRYDEETGWYYALSRAKGVDYDDNKYEKNVLPYHQKQKPKKKRSTMRKGGSR